MKIALVDLKHPIYGFANRDQTGGFGSSMKVQGRIGKIISLIKRNKVRLPVISLAYLNAIAENTGHECNIYDGIPAGEDIVLIASSMHHHKYELEFAELVKSNFPSSRVGFIGPFACEFPDIFLLRSDFVLNGEPELVFEDFLNLPLSHIHGLIDLPVSTTFLDLPFPSWNGFRINEYGYFPALPRKPFLTIQASRGCPFACDFCPYIVSQGVDLRRRNNSDIVDEIQELVGKYGIKSLLFRDITWSMDIPSTKELCHMISDCKLDLDIGVETRADMLDNELISLMASAGVRSVNLGIESPNERMLLEEGRTPIKNSKLLSIITELEKNNIQVQAFYILGLMNDTKESIERNIKFSWFLNTFTAQYCVLTPFPGTRTFDDLKDHIVIKDYSFYDEYTPVVNINNLSREEVRHYLSYAFSSYYKRPRWLIKHIFTLAKALFNSIVS